MNTLNDRDLLNRSISPVVQQKKFGPVEGGTVGTNVQNWARTAADTNVAKSTVISNMRSSNLNLPEKLQRMKERVKRDRSANQQTQSQGREDSLYGRKKMASEVDLECQRLRESYGKHRKPHSRGSVGSRSLLSKNFKEDPFDDQLSNPRGRGSASFERRASDKENVMRLSQAELRPEGNRYKRTQQRSNQALASYQQKYERLEKNFKKFANNIMHAHQSEQIIGDLKYKAGFSILAQVLKKSAFKDQKRGFKIWRINSGVALKQYENQERTSKLAKCANKMHLRSLNHVKILYYQKWKRLALSAAGHQGGRERVVSQLAEIITDTKAFNQCVESDFYLAGLLNQIIPKIVNGTVSSDFIFHPSDGSSQLKTYHDASGECLTFEAGDSILGRTLNENFTSEQFSYSHCPIKVIEHLQQEANFNEEVDMPVNQEPITQLNKSQNNPFNKVRGLASILVSLSYPSRLGVLRLFFSSEGTSVGSPTNFQVKQVQALANVLPLYLTRIFEVRQQINSLALTSLDQSAQITQMQGFEQITRHLHWLQTRLLEEEHIVCQTKDTLLEFVKTECEAFLKTLGLDDPTLRQVVAAPGQSEGRLLLAEEGPLVRYNDHIQEARELLEDFLDYKRDYFVHQVSVRPKDQDFADLTFILQMIQPYAERGINTSMNSSLRKDDSKKQLSPEQATHLTFYFKMLTPIVMMGLKISDDLSNKVKSLETSLKAEELAKGAAQQFQSWVNDRQLLKESSRQLLQHLLHEGLQACLSTLADSPNVSLQTVFLNRFAFLRTSGASALQGVQQQYFSFMDSGLAENLQYVLLEKLNQGTERLSNQQIAHYFSVLENEEGESVEVGAATDILPTQQVILDDYFQDESQRLVFVPLLSEDRLHMMALLVVSAPAEALDLLSHQQAVLQRLINDFSTKRQEFQTLHEQHMALLRTLDGEKVSQEAKDQIEQVLVVPYLRKPTLKVLGDAIDSLADRLVQNSGEKMESFGQEISQIAYLSKSTFIEDVRLLQSYSQSLQQPDQIMLQSFQQQQQIVYEDEILDKVVILYPILGQSPQVSNSKFSTAPRAQPTALILRFVIERDEYVEAKLQNIHLQLINCIQPVVASAIQNEGAQVRYALGMAKITASVDKFRFGCYREIIQFMRDLQAKNVYNFARSRLFDKITRSRRFLELKQQEDELFDVEQRHFEKNKVVQALVREALLVMNKYAHRQKGVYFKKFLVGTKKPLYASLSKKKKKALTALLAWCKHATQRSLFLKWAVNVKQFKGVSHPRTRFVGSVMCIFRNFRVVRQRLAFIKMKKNLNMFLRQSMKSYVENDKDLFIQLNQILLSSYQQQGGLEGGFTYALSEILNYLKNQMIQDQYVKDFMAHPDGFVGHLDEVVLTMKSHVYTSHGGSGMNLLGQNQKVSVFHGKFNAPAAQKPKALKVQYDSNLGVSQQLMNQINMSNIDNQFEQEFNAENDFDPNLSQQFSKYTIGLKRDLIHQMLGKSNGIIFNFQNIQQSLSDIFLNQQSQHKDHNIGNRLAIVRRSKSALIIPLFDVALANIIGSLELYKHHQLAFSDEIEQRYNYFSKRLADFFLLYGQLRAQSFQIQQLKVQLQKNVRPTNSLSQLLKNVYINAPGNHFPGASHVLPIIILNTAVRVGGGSQYDFGPEMMSDTQELLGGTRIETQKLAFFYQFKDNHIYNFDYEGTFIEELMDNGCILEMCQKNQMAADEGSQMLSGADNGGPSIMGSQADHRMNDLPTERSGQEGLSFRSNFGLGSGLGGSRFKNRTVQSSNEKVKSITNELFKHIIYYPVFDSQDEQKIVAILEVAYKKKEVQDEIITDDIQQYLEQFRSHLAQFKVRMTSFCRGLEHLVRRREEKRSCQLFQNWKQFVNQSQFQEKFDQYQFEQMQNQEAQYGEYMQNLENFSTQLKQTTSDKDRMAAEITQFVVEKKAKLKFLATSLVSSQNLFKRIQRQRCKEAFLKWQYNVSIRKIASTAFTRVLELNHRHSLARYKASLFLLRNLVENYAIREAFENVLQAAHMRRNNAMRYSFTENVSGLRRSCSRSRSNKRQGNAENSYILNNITSLLSPANMKKIEKKNLYQMHLNSFYTPGGEAANNSAIVNPKSLFENQNGSQLIQLRPEEVVKEANTSRVRAASKTRTFDQSATAASRYSAVPQTQGQARASRASRQNPYSDVNLSQIEFTQNKRDYSPIITSAKYDFRRVQPLGQASATRSDSVPSHKKARSVENYRRDGPRMKAGTMTTTKAELQRQLHLKQKQLTQMKKHLLNPKTVKESAYASHSGLQQQRTRNYGTCNGRGSNGSSKRSSSINLKVGPLQGTHYSSKNFSSTNHDASRFSQRPKSSSFMGKSEKQRKSCERLSRKSAHQRQRSGLVGNSRSSIDPADASYYQKINGRDVSPPVRLGPKKAAEKKEQEREESLKRARMNVAAALHEKYSQLNN